MAKGYLAIALLSGIETDMREKALADGFDAIVEAYYNEYTDATELDGKFRSALKLMFETFFPHGELPDGREFEELVNKPGTKYVPAE